jgi:hypothetical protein
LVTFCVVTASYDGLLKKDKKRDSSDNRRGRRHSKLLEDRKERRYSHLKEEVLDRTMWRVRYRKGFGPVLKQTAE